MRQRTAWLVLGTVVLANGWMIAGATYVRTPGNSVPLYHHEMKALEESLYAYYNQHGYVPDDDAWMNDADRRAIVKAGGAIAWDASEQTLSYEYEKAYPINLSLPHILTFGLIPSEPKGLGHSMDKETIIHNARLRAGDIDPGETPAARF